MIYDMKVNFNQSFKDFKGNEVGVMISDEIGKVLFNLSTSNKTPLSADEKYMAYKLCNKVCRDDIELSAEEAAFILRAVGEFLTAGAYGQIRDLIEG